MHASFHKYDIKAATLKNNHYRKVIVTTPQMQQVLMHLKPGEDIPTEIHKHTTQIISVEEGTGVAYIDGEMVRLKDGSALTIFPGSEHYIKATSDLRLYTIYSPPEHPDKLIQRRAM